MSEADGEKWNSRYATGDYVPRTRPSRFLVESLPAITPGPALVTACGAGRNALYLASKGFQVDGFDVSPVAIEMARKEAQRRQLEINFQVVDLEANKPSPDRYQLITMVRYMNRPLWPSLVRALAPGGWLLLEMHLQTDEDVIGPSSPDFRTEPGELLTAFSELQIVSYEEVVEPSERDNGRYSALAKLLARREIVQPSEARGGFGVAPALGTH